MGGDDTKTTGCKRNDFGLIYGKLKTLRKSRMENNMTKELEHKEGPKAEIHIYLLKNTLKIIKL